MDELTRNPRGDRDLRIAGILEKGLAADEAAYDGQRHMVGGPKFAPARSLPLAYEWMTRGDEAPIDEVCAILDAVFAAQETRPLHPHRGNWLWLADDTEIVDLNAIQVVMRGLLPLLIDHGERLPVETQALCRERIALALDEQERMAVSPIYSGVHVVSLFCQIAGAEWLGDPHYVEVARERWTDWVTFTATSGNTHEFNSPVYAPWALGALGLIQRYGQDETIRLQAALFAERLWLGLALKLHYPTHQLAAPHARVYWGPMVSGQNPVKDVIWRETGWQWLLEPGPYGGRDAYTTPAGLDLARAAYDLPDVARTWLLNQESALPYEVRETSDVDEGQDTTTYLTPTYALGSTNRTYSIGTECFYIDHEANHLMLHYARPSRLGGWGMMYTRYLVNDRHWGTLGAAPDRPKDSCFYDQGHFCGTQLRNKAIGLYALMPQEQEVFSLKSVVAFYGGASLDEVYVNERRIDVEALAEAPETVGQGDWLVVADGAVFVGIYPLAQSPLTGEAPIVLEHGPVGELWLTAYNYKGLPKRFWDYASLRGAFWRGNIRAGCIVEVADRSEHADAAAFLAHLRLAEIEDTVDEAFVRTVTYRSGGDTLSLDYDLWHTEPGERRFGGTPYAAPMLRSPLAVQGDSGHLAVGGARLDTAAAPMWLVACEVDPADRTWIAVNPLGTASALRFETPRGVVTADEWGLGRIQWRARAGEADVVEVMAAEEPGGLVVPGGVDVVLRGT